MNSLTINIAEELSDSELIVYIKEQWHVEEFESIYVVSELNVRIHPTTDYHYYYISNIKSVKGKAFEYPLIDIEDREKLINNGVFVPPSFNNTIKKYIDEGGIAKIKCKLVLSSSAQRIKHNNPFLLNVDSTTIQVLNKISKQELVEDQEGNYLIEESLLKHFTKKYTKKINEVITVIENTRADKESELEQLTKSFKGKIEKKQVTLENKLTKLKSNHANKIQEMDSEESKKQKSINKLEEKTKLIDKEMKNGKSELNELMIKIQEIREILKNEEGIMGEKLEKLRSYVRDKANTLLELEFIDQTEYNNLLMIKEDSIIDEKFINFENDLANDKQKAISHIQAYLFEKDIVYPRYILEDFLALVQTNDLIILAGESGSGKTNLIKSFAQAIGGKSFIIPVKPNWTSSEDLLGYYNPLEKKYLTTPFLEALLEAKDNPDVPYFICLDEMNLARVEYYFADFLSLLEERGEPPKINLYSDDESSHILSEFKNVMETIEYTKEKYKKKNIVNFMQLLQDEEINKELTRIFGFSDKDSLIKYHTDLRRMLGGILNTPSSILFPSNVRIIGAINIDETTHYLSPKILDRAHIMKFDSPLLQDWDKIENEIENVDNKDFKIKFKIEDLGTRKAYPSFDRKNDFCKTITDMTRKYFTPLGIEVGLRTIRQGLNYQKIFIEQGSSTELVINNFILHKILPKLTFDGSKKDAQGIEKIKLLKLFMDELEKNVVINNDNLTYINVISELTKVIDKSNENESIVNYWS